MGRISGHPNGSLTLKNVSKADVGTYTAGFVTYSLEGNKDIKIELVMYGKFLTLIPLDLHGDIYLYAFMCGNIFTSTTEGGWRLCFHPCLSICLFVCL